MTFGQPYASHDQLFPPFSDGNNMATSKKDDWDYAKDEDLIDYFTRQTDASTTQGALNTQTVT